tara:strand:+ start:317 stop:1741 length:1425 start_codon:yes stop_codon:yes gene_type:complete
MAKASIRKNLAEGIKTALNRESNLRQRAALQNSRPQIIFLYDLEFINDTITEMLKRRHLRKDLTVKFTAEDLREARSKAKEYQDFYLKNNKHFKEGPAHIENTMAGTHLKRSDPKAYNDILAGVAFLVSSFSAIGALKKELVKMFVKGSKKQLAAISSRVDRGHGAGKGTAVSGVQIAEAQSKAAESLTKDELDAYNEELTDFLYDAYLEEKLDLQTYSDLVEVLVEYEQIIDPNTGDLDVNYIPYITYQDKYTNQVVDGAREKAAKDVIAKFADKLGAGGFAKLEGSSTIEEKMVATVISQLVKTKLEKSVSISAKLDPKKVKFKTSGRASQKGSPSKRSGSSTKVKPKAPKLLPVKNRKKTNAKTSKSNLKNLLGILNAKLPTVVARNMGAPKLVNRTGRFAQSVQATDVTPTPQGFPSIGYTYDRSRYGVFESTSGNSRASTDRDPRILIDQSIREIAASFTLGRLYTRRQ